MDNNQNKWIRLIAIILSPFIAIISLIIVLVGTLGFGCLIFIGIPLVGSYEISLDLLRHIKNLLIQK